MGAESFSDRAAGKNAQAAFESAVKQAQYDYGHAGYTGTIAEKSSFIMLDLPEDFDREDPWFDYKPGCPAWEAVDDKWGPAGCFDLGEGQYLFFGWASS